MTIVNRARVGWMLGAGILIIATGSAHPASAAHSGAVRLIPSLPQLSAVSSTVGPNVLVNDRANDVLPIVSQDGPSVAAYGNQLLVGFFDNTACLSPPLFCSGYSRSLDGGATWTAMGSPTAPLGDVLVGLEDPVVVADRPRAPGETGVFYFGHVAADFSSNLIIGVHKTIDTGTTWVQAANASPLAGGASEYQQKEWIAVDTRASGPGAGNVYVCWDRVIAPDLLQRSIQFSRSTDGGQTFTQLAGGLSSSPTTSTGCQVAVNPLNGDVYVAWVDYNDLSTIQNHFRRSTDHGVTFGPDIVVASVGFAATPFDCGFGFPIPVFLDKELGNETRPILSLLYPSLAVNPVTGDIYVAREQAGLAGGDESDISVSRSADGGMTWSAPARINSVATGQQFFPSVAVNSDGRIGVMYYSTQNSPTDRLIDVYEVVSQNGLTWSAPIRVTDVSFDRPITNPASDPQNPNCWMGTYNTITAAAPGLGNKNFYIAWSDNHLDADPAAPGVQPDPDIRVAVSQPAAPSGVCAYTVTAAEGYLCSLRVGDTVCQPASGSTGPCNAPLSCFRGFNSLCLATMVPKSGPQLRCPFESRRPIGFKCYR